MSIIKAIDNAYRKMQDRNWDTVYWCIDLHGVCLKSNYQTGEYEWINKKAQRALRMISARVESKIILWSSIYNREHAYIDHFFFEHGIFVDAINRNDWEDNTDTGCFDSKFYFSVLLDDKAGFDPDEDWDAIIKLFESGKYGK